MYQQFVLEDFPTESQAAIKLAGRVRQLSAGDLAFAQGDASEVLLLVESGLLDIGISTSSGKRLTLNIVGAGSVVGEIGLLDGEGRTAEALALQDCQIRWLTKTEVFSCFENLESANEFFIQVLCKRIRWINKQSEQGQLLPASSVLANRLLMLSEERSGEWVSVSQEGLASQSGLTREYVNHILIGWKKQGLIELRRGGFKIIQLDGLRPQ